MKKTILILCIAAVLIVIGLFVRYFLRREETIQTVTCRNHFGYTLTMTVSGEKITVTYLNEGREPVVRTADRSCLDNINGILAACDFPSWRKLSVKKGAEDDSDTLEITFQSGKSCFFRASQELPEKAHEAFRDISSCLSEYAGIVK